MTNSEINIKNSFNLPCNTNTLYEIESNEDFLKLDYNKSDEFLIIGECTNLVLPTKLNKKVIKSKNSTINKISSTLYRVGSAANWNDFVLSVIEDNRFGIENLIGIPGSVGAAPVQNIGAYGVQVSDFIKSINIYDIEDKTFKKLLKDQCDFGYRSSIFQTKPYFIIDIDFEFNHIDKLNMDYEGIRQLISSQNKDMKSITSKELGEIICELRTSKLPNPKTIPNVGSFFKNPIICLDGDESGQNAALRIAEKFFSLINEEYKIYFSIMPEGLIKVFSDQELIDLISYLEGNEQVPLP